jgi:hypothetical protein
MKFQLYMCENHKTIYMCKFCEFQSVKLAWKNIYYFYINDMHVLFMMSWYEVYMIYNLTKSM